MNSDLWGGWVGGPQVKNHTTLWSNLQDCKISSKVEISKLDPCVAIREGWAEFCHTGTSIAQAYSTIVFPVCSNFYFKTEGSFKLKTEIRKVSSSPFTHRGRVNLTVTFFEHLSRPKD